MARKISQYTVDAQGRDFGKVFQLTEMPSSQAEKWALRALLAMVKEGIDLPEGFEHSGMAGVARMGIGAIGKLPFDTAELLLDEMLQCIKIMPDPNNRQVVRNLIEDDIEEVSTRVKLRVAIFKLHTDFSSAAAPLTSAQA